MICDCTSAQHLADLVIPACKESLGQLQKVIFQRRFSAPGVRNTLTAPGTKASWDDLFTASDSTKCIITPFIQGPTTEPGAARTWGSGNEVLGGQPIIIGAENTTFTGNIYQEQQSVIKTLKTYMCEQELAVWLIDEHGNIGCLVETTTSGQTTTTNYYPIPIRSLFIGDKNLGGYDGPDGNVISWSFAPDWSDNFTVVKPDEGFNPLIDLVNKASI